MVRLKFNSNIMNQAGTGTFQFLYGTIKIKAKVQARRNTLLFQFLYGTIKMRKNAHCSSLSQGFNSYMVRLKST